MPHDLGRTVVTVGNFDGVHRGHQHVVARAREVAGQDGTVVAVTFDPHPMAVLRPEHAPQTLTSLETRARLLGDAGVDAVLVVPFTREVAAWSPERFVVDVLVEALHARAVVVGANFRFGTKASGDVATLTELGRTHDFTAEGIALDGGPQVWSSTYVRSCLLAGDVEGAAEALGHPFSVRGEVVKGDQRGRELGYPTANVPTTGMLAAPADGVYAGWLLPVRRRRAAAPGRDQRRHQPDVRGRARAPRGVLRAGPRRPRAVRRAGRGVLRGPHPRHAPLRLRRRARRDDGPRRRAHPRGPRRLMVDRGPWLCATRSSGSCGTGCPTSCSPSGRSSQRGLSRNRLLPVVGLALLVGAVVGVGSGLWLQDVSGGLVFGLWGAGAVLAVYAGTTLRLRIIARWAVGRTLGSLGLMFPLVTRALPLLMLFITFLFINTEVWMVANSLDPGVLTMAVMFFAAMAIGFLLVRLPEEMDRVDDDTDTGRLVARTQGTPVEHCSREVFDEIPEDELRDVLEVAGSRSGTSCWCCWSPSSCRCCCCRSPCWCSSWSSAAW